MGRVQSDSGFIHFARDPLRHISMNFKKKTIHFLSVNAMEMMTPERLSALVWHTIHRLKQHQHFNFN